MIMIDSWGTAHLKAIYCQHVTKIFKDHNIFENIIVSVTGFMDCLMDIVVHDLWFSYHSMINLSYTQHLPSILYNYIAPQNGWLVAIYCSTDLFTGCYVFLHWLVAIYCSTYWLTGCYILFTHWLTCCYILLH